VKLKGNGIKVCFVKHTFGPKKIRSDGPEAQAQPGLNSFHFYTYCLWAGSSPAVQAGLDPVGLAWSLA